MKKLCVILVLIFTAALVSFEGRSLAASEEEQVSDQSVDSEGKREQSEDEVKLRVYRNALFDSPKEQNRIDAAVVLLGYEDPAAKEILQDALKAAEKPEVRSPVLKAMVLLDKEGGLSDKNQYRDQIFNALKTAKGDVGRLAARVLTIYPYSEIADYICELAKKGDADQQARINAIYALGLTSEKRGSLICLVDILDSSNQAIASAARKALPYWISVDGDAPSIKRELQNKEPEEIIRERIIRLEDAMKQVQATANKWKNLYIKRLDQEYERLDDKGKGNLIFDELATEFAEVALWAMNKLEKRSATVVLPEKIGERLVSLLADESAEVRLKTAEVLAKMGDRNPGPGLLKQLRAEENESVKLAILEALGEACYFAFSPGSPVKLDPAVRLAALDEAAEYLMSEDPSKAIAGAAVIRKVLEPNGLDDEAKEKYLGLIAERFVREEKNDQLRAELIEVMASLAEQPSTRSKAAKLFKESFLQGLSADQNAAVRRAGLRGLAALDKATALEHSKKHQVEDDPDRGIRLSVIRLAGDVGAEADLEWLLDKLKADKGEGETAWQAMQSILLRQKAEVLVKWAEKLEAAGVSEERVDYVLRKAAQKAEGENDSALINKANRMLTNRRVSRALKNGSFDEVAELIRRKLVEGDIEANGIIAKRISDYVGGSAPDESKKDLVKALGNIKFSDERTQWAKMINNWQGEYDPDPQVASKQAEQDAPQPDSQDNKEQVSPQVSPDPSPDA
ncbi:hypothetical protein STSP2_03068 [Anaerohalosphaera lusitana]|uniref:HEAT repeat domain-containing protein n=1 Tax=Anaerohalosphaera lusitana TaxID=1936003 RepID=A0A1U9NQ73_9BACT|nr:HEAT repeat domain-containing protein [Anaerohalosphaera lusitana]AQT69868.1 hypothetical protein STSP2_03068 [Anaerohalosphaera lusitana]